MRSQASDAKTPLAPVAGDGPEFRPDDRPDVGPDVRILTRPRDLVTDLAPPATGILEATRPCSHQDTSIESLAVLAATVRATGPDATIRRTRAVRNLLSHLVTLPGEGWAARWEQFEATRPAAAGDWTLIVLPDAALKPRRALQDGVLTLIKLDVIRPSYAWLQANRSHDFEVSRWRYPFDAARLEGKLASFGNDRREALRSLRLVGQIQGRTGKRLQEVDAADLLDFARDHATARHLQGVRMLWRALHELGWLQHPSTKLPSRTRVGQRSFEELVDFHGVDPVHREVLIEYLKHRTAAMDYSTRQSTARLLLKYFWSDLVKHHPELAEQPSFALTRAQAEAWKQRIRFTDTGAVRKDTHPILFAVRAFYVDIAQWALHDSYWAPWVAPSPIYSRELRGYNKHRRRVIADYHQRTRELAPLLPKLVAKAEAERRETSQAHEAALAAGHGGTIEYRGRPWRVFQSSTTSPVRLRANAGLAPAPGSESAISPGSRAEEAGSFEEINLSRAENDAFWTWAIIETLRHTGIRHEELLELTHLAIQPYKVPTTGETLPLLHIVPSKTDQERLLVAGPELVHVLAQIVNRIRAGHQAVPLTQRWDHHEKVLGPPLPHLFLTRRGSDIMAMTANTAAKLIKQAARGIANAAGEPVDFTPQDLRRIFATDALSSGLPPHIVQVLLGHKSLATTQGYTAIYPQDVIRHHRTFITQRRSIRPSEEYREPTAAEWEEFEAHFVARKVSLGSCGRAYGTNCHHEHACIRCALLRPDPTQLDRLVEIITNLKDRITEAKENGWLGEVEGLEISLSGARHKLGQMQQQLRAPDEPVTLGLPARRVPPGRSGRSHG